MLRSGQLTDKLTLKICRGDLTEQLVGCIVNASNRELILGGGVAGAINARGGRTIQAELDTIRAKQFLPNVGECVVTNGGLLPAKRVIHAVRIVIFESPRLGRTSIYVSCHAKSFVNPDIGWPKLSAGSQT